MSITIITKQLAILFIMIFTGYFLNKMNLFGGELDKKLTKLVLYFTMPAMILSSVLNQTGERDGMTVIWFFVIAIVMYLALPLLAFLLSHLLHIPANHRGIYMFMMIFGNVGFMGFPIVSAIFGDDSLLYAGIFNIIFNILAYSYGIYIVSKDSHPDSGFQFNPKMLLTPGISVSVFAVIVYFLNIPFPDFIKSPITSFGNMTTPLAMLLIGSTLAGMNAKSVFTDIRIYIFVFVRCFLLPLALFPLLKLLIKDSFLLEFTFIMLLMPVANSAVLFAKEYGSDEHFAAKGIFLSTLFSIITIPLLIYLCF